LVMLNSDELNLAAAWARGLCRRPMPAMGIEVSEPADAATVPMP
jgi:hypothetical protein